MRGSLLCLLALMLSCTRSPEPGPEARAGPDKSICSGGSTVIGTVGAPGCTYSWSPSEGLDNPASSQPRASPSAPTTYTLTVTDSLSGRTSTDTVTITVASPPPAGAGPNQNLCSGSSVVLGSAPLAGLVYRWSPSTGLNFTTVPQPTASPSTTTTYTLTVQNPVTGCSQTSSATLTVLPSAQASFTMSTPLMAGAYIQFTDTSTGSPISWLWNFGDGTTSTSQNPLHLYCASGTYAVTLTVTATTGCQTITTQSIIINPLVTNPINVSNNVSSSMAPNIEIDSLDTAHVVWFDNSPGNFDVFYSFKPSGGSFTTPVNVSQNPGASYFDLSLAVDMNDNLHLVWQDESPGEWRVLYSEKPFGSPWSAPSSIYNPIASSGYPDVVVDNTGIVHVWWTEWVGSNNDTYYAFNNGSGWSSPVNISSNAGASFVPSAVVDAARTLYVVWEDSTPGNYDIFFSTKPAGGSWSSPLNISTNSGDSEFPQMVMDSQGRLHVVWQDKTPGNADIFYALRLTDGTWTPPLNISSNPGQSMLPAIAVDSMDTIHVVWSDSSCGTYQVYYAKRSVSGIWSLPENISGTTGNAIPPWIAVDSTGLRHVVWSDDSTGNNEILYRSF